ncbi:MAG: alpha-glucosidase [Proteobacteria bacterium]|nr:alpha-glucosidase [Pseudomonadota bacterium]
MKRIPIFITQLSKRKIFAMIPLLFWMIIVTYAEQLNAAKHDMWPEDDIHEYVLQDFVFTWHQKIFRVAKISGEVLLASAAGQPIVAPVKVRENANFNKVTVLFSPNFTIRSDIVGDITLSSVTENTVTFELSLHNFCRTSMMMTFEVIHSNALELKVAYRGHSNPNMPFDSACEHLAFTMAKEPDEYLMGLGTQYTHLRLQDRIYTTISQEQGHGRGLQPLTWISNRLGKGTGGDETTSYHYVPHIISRNNRSLWLYGYHYAHFDLRQRDKIIVITSQPSLHLRLNSGSSIGDLLREFAQAFGTTKPLPNWVHRGAMLGIQGGEDRVRETVKRLRALNAELSSVWIQDWIGTFQTFLGQRLLWNWQLDKKFYPRWQQLVQDLKDDQIAVISYFNPRLVHRKCEGSCRLDIAKNKGYLVKDRHGLPILIGNGGFNFAKLDLFSVPARQWFGALMHQHAQDSPVKGWMADFSEALPYHARMADGRNGQEAHNAYIYEWAKLNGEVIDHIDDGFVFMRGGTLGSHKYVHAFWLGDQLTTWDRYDGLHSTIIGLISSGLSGALVNHSDIGGLTSIHIPLVANIVRDKELFLRWMQLNAFTPIFRSHEGLKPWLLHQFDSDLETLHQFVRYSRIFAYLFPYRKKLVRESQEEGFPLVRGMFFAHPQFKESWHVDDQFMLGDELIVAPVIHPGTVSREVFLPPGCWVEVFSGQIYNLSTATRLTVEVTPHNIPVFALYNSESHDLLEEILNTVGR